MNRVTSDEFQKKFASYKAKAHREAVVITSHGQDDVCSFLQMNTIG